MISRAAVVIFLPHAWECPYKECLLFQQQPSPASRWGGARAGRALRAVASASQRVGWGAFAENKIRLWPKLSGFRGQWPCVGGGGSEGAMCGRASAPRHSRSSRSAGGRGGAWRGAVRGWPSAALRKRGTATALPQPATRVQRPPWRSAFPHPATPLAGCPRRSLAGTVAPEGLTGLARLSCLAPSVPLRAPTPLPFAVVPWGSRLSAHRYGILSCSGSLLGFHSVSPTTASATLPPTAKARRGAAWGGPS